MKLILIANILLLTIFATAQKDTWIKITQPEGKFIQTGSLDNSFYAMPEDPRPVNYYDSKISIKDYFVSSDLKKFKFTMEYQSLACVDTNDVKNYVEFTYPDKGQEFLTGTATSIPISDPYRYINETGAFLKDFGGKNYILKYFYVKRDHFNPDPIVKYTGQYGSYLREKYNPTFEDSHFAVIDTNGKIVEHGTKEAEKNTFEKEELGDWKPCSPKSIEGEFGKEVCYVNHGMIVKPTRNHIANLDTITGVIQFNNRHYDRTDEMWIIDMPEVMEDKVHVFYIDCYYYAGDELELGEVTPSIQGTDVSLTSNHFGPNYYFLKLHFPSGTLGKDNTVYGSFNIRFNNGELLNVPYMLRKQQ